MVVVSYKLCNERGTLDAGPPAAPQGESGNVRCRQHPVRTAWHDDQPGVPGVAHVGFQGRH